MMTKVQVPVATSSSSNARKRARKKAVKKKKGRTSTTTDTNTDNGNHNHNHKPQQELSTNDDQTKIPNSSNKTYNANATPSRLSPRRRNNDHVNNTSLNNHENHNTNTNNANNSTKKKNKKKRKRNQVNDKQDDEVVTEEPEDDLLAFAAAWANDTPATDNVATFTVTSSNSNCNQLAKHHKKPKISRLPPPFPKDNPRLKLPPHGFLKNHEPYRPAFQAVLDTCYEGLVWESHQAKEAQLQRALQVMDQHGLFRTDVTQPAGLGAKLVPSYVTRCLLGEEGTTYRYLGLRMFAHPWNGHYHNNNNNNNNNSNAVSPELQSALQTFETLNTGLTEQTKRHLQDLAHQRQRRGETQQPLTVGRAGFNVTLINKMTMDNYKRLREEPMFQNQKYTVGWHADSSLEHYSTIAVYHTLIHDNNNNNNNNNHNNNNNVNKNPSKKKPRKSNTATSTSEQEEQDNEWMVALRVTHNAEGPHAKRLGDITVDETAPPIAVALPSGSTYFMLDDFNHHHQHAVLAPNDTHTATKTIRYSSTHRLLRQGHTVQDMLARCQKVLSIPKGHEPSSSTTTTTSHDALFMSVSRLPHGPKHWRSEQVLLNELENEWLRQFFIQGSDHKRLLWAYWQQPIQQLFQYWELLEARTLQVVTLLQRASEVKCGKLSSTTQKEPEKDQGKEALQIVTRIAQGGDNKKHKHKNTNKSTIELIYNPVATHILERAKSRELWAKRERDVVFQRLPQDCRPIPFPVVYASEVNPTGASTTTTSTKSNSSPMACSSMPNGSSEYLSQLASNVQAWGKAFETGDVKLLPKDNVLKL